MTFEKKEAASEAEREFVHRAAKGSSGLFALGAIIGLAGGITSALFGSLLVAATWFVGRAVSDMATFGTILLVLTIPLLAFGAHCLDVLERQKKKAKEARFK